MKVKKNRFKIIISFLLFILLLTIVLGVIVKSKKTRNVSNQNQVVRTPWTSSQRKHSNKNALQSIVGSYQNKSEGAAIVFYKDHTGRYVYYDSTDENTDDSFTWKKSNDRYSLRLDDDTVTSKITANIKGNTLVLSGDSNWNTEKLYKVKGDLDLDDFLNQYNESSSADSSNKESTRVITSPEDAARLIEHADHVDPGVCHAVEVDDGYIVNMPDMPDQKVLVHYDGSATWPDGTTQSYAELSAPTSN